MVFPGEEQSVSESPGVTTVAAEEAVDATSLTLMLIILAVVVVVLLLSFGLWWWLARRRRGREKSLLPEKEVSFTGTLGATYSHTRAFTETLPPLPETTSLLGSRKSSGGTAGHLERAEDAMDGWDGRVSR